MALLSRKRSLLQSQKLVRRERVKQWLRMSFVVALFVGLLWGLSAVSYIDKLNVQTVLVTGNAAVPTEEVLDVARDALRGRNFFLFSSANIFWYAKQQMIDTLRYTYSWIDEVEIYRVNLSTIAIKVKERVPIAVWCGVSPEKAQPCQLMDRDGRLFAKAPEFDGAAYIKLYGPLGDPTWRGPLFFSKTGLDHVLGFVKELPEVGFQPLAAAVVGTNAYDVFAASGTRISAQLSDSIPSIVSNIDSLLTQKLFAQSQMGNFSNLLYIDARFGNKLFYKFKNASTTHE